MRSKARNKPPGFVIAYTTAANKADAGTIAGTLVRERLAACVNVVPDVSSVYTWKGRSVRGKELLLIIKTRGSLLERIKKRIKSLSPYEVPEFLAVDVAYGSRDYLAWLAQNTRP